MVFSGMRGKLKKLTHVLYESKSYQSFEVNKFPHNENSCQECSGLFGIST